MGIRMVRLKASAAPQGFVSTSYIGEFVREKNGCIELKNTAIVYEILNQSRTGDINISNNYFTNSLTTNGIWKVREADIHADREVEKDDEILTGYNSALEQFRLSKLNIAKANAVPPQQLHGRA